MATLSQHEVEAIVTTLYHLAADCDAEQQRWAATDQVMAREYRGKKEAYRNSARLIDTMLQIEIVAEEKSQTDKLT
jgi:hypothetical protein